MVSTRIVVVLPGAVRAEQAEDLAGAHLEGDPGHGLDRAEADDEPVDLDHALGALLDAREHGHRVASSWLRVRRASAAFSVSRTSCTRSSASSEASTSAKNCCRCAAHARDELAALGGQPDQDRAAVALLAAALGQAELLEPVDEPRRGRVVDADAVGQLAHPQAVVLGQQLERAQLAGRQLRPQLGVQRGVQPAAGEDRAELAPAGGELGGERSQ